MILWRNSAFELFLRQKRNDTIKVPIEKLIQIEIKSNRSHLQMYHYGRNLTNGF